MALIYRNVPRKKTNELLLLGDRISAPEAVEYGLANKVVPRRRVRRRRARLGRASWPRKSPLIMRLGKDAMFRQQDMAFADALEFLHAQLTIALSTDDIVEGVTAFFEKREPAGPAGERRAAWSSRSRCRTSDRVARRRRGVGGARAALRPSTSAIETHTIGRRRRAKVARPLDEDLDESRGCLLEAGGQVEDALNAGLAPVLLHWRVLDRADDAARGRAHPARRAVALARRARRLQHARHDRAASTWAGWRWPAACGEWDAGLRRRLRRPERRRARRRARHRGGRARAARGDRAPR